MSIALLLATIFVDVLAAYFALGVLFALWFVAAGIGRVDPVAKESGVGFRLMILPGVVATWPWLLRRWVAARVAS